MSDIVSGRDHSAEDVESPSARGLAFSMDTECKARRDQWISNSVGTTKVTTYNSDPLENIGKGVQKVATANDWSLSSPIYNSLLAWGGHIDVGNMEKYWPVRIQSKGPYLQGLTTLSWIMVGIVIILDVSPLKPRMLYDIFQRLLFQDKYFEDESSWKRFKGDLELWRREGYRRRMRPSVVKYLQDRVAQATGQTTLLEIFPEDIKELTELLVWLLRREKGDAFEAVSPIVYAIGGTLVDVGIGLTVGNIRKRKNQPLIQMLPMEIKALPVSGVAFYLEDPSCKHAKGTNTIVRKGTFAASGQTVAVKRFRVTSLVERDAVMQESKLLEQCSHPNVVQYIGLYRKPSYPLTKFDLVMAPWAPTTLYDLITRRNGVCPWFAPNSDASETIVLRIFRHITEGLAHLHHKDVPIKHKDIKPTNILLAHAEDAHSVTAMIADLGVSKRVIPKHPTDYTKSTFTYLAPEQVAHRDSSILSDVFALGCCFLQGMAVSKYGGSGIRDLDNIITGEGRSCRFATELPAVEDFRTKMMLEASPREITMLSIIRDMLEEDPRSRCCIASVRGRLPM